MYKVLIVEDEYLVRKGLTVNVGWESLGFEVSSSASNGLKALKSIEQQIPDVLFTDIKMPVMTGIELMKIVKDKYPSIKIVILSGFGEFNFVKQALECGALEYILKPTETENIVRVFTKLKTMLDEETNKKLIQEKKEKQLKESLPLLRNKFLNDLVKGDIIINENIIEKATYLGLELKEKNYCVLYISIDEFIEQSNEENNCEKKLQLDVLNAIENIIYKFTSAVVFEIDINKFIVIICNSNYEVSIFNKYKREVANEIKTYINDLFNKDVTIGMGRVYEGVKNIKLSYSESEYAYQYKLYMGTNRVIDVEEMYQFEDISYTYSRENEESLLENLSINNKEKVFEIINVIFDKILERRCLPIEHVQWICMELLISSSKCLNEMGLNSKEILPDNIISFKEIAKYETITEIRNWMHTIFESILNNISEILKQSKSKIINEIMNYMNQNYSDEVTLKGIADFSHINPEYLSRLFKKETGKNFIDFLTDVRMHKAKELIRNNKDIKLFEVAEKVGYKDAKYFSRVFKSYISRNSTSIKKNK